MYKAFDSVSHNILLRKCAKLNVDSFWFSSYTTPMSECKPEDIHLYARAELAGARNIVGELATKAREQESFWVMVEFALRWSNVPTIACV